MLSVGIDLVETARIKKAMDNPHFCGRILGSEEYSQLERRGFPVQSVAASFSAKEAFSKAVGTGLGILKLREIELLRGKMGQPALKLSGRALEIAGSRCFSVSVTHTADYAAAIVAGTREVLGFDLPEDTERLLSLWEMIKPRRADSNKGDYGRLLCACGSEGMAGAAVMSAKAALRCGVGIVDVALSHKIYPIVASQIAEPVFTLLDISPTGELLPAGAASLRSSLLKASACLVGCGLGSSAAARAVVYNLLNTAQVPLILDADGINIIAENINVLKTVRVPLILTPHPGEMARLLKTTVADVQANREKYAEKFAAQHNVILVLKGAGTLVAAPDGRLYKNSTGNPGMAKGGSGDVLAGMIASFAAQGIEPFSAAAGAVYLHGLAGDRCAQKLSQCAMLPTDMIDTLPELFSQIGR